ncbi:MULTISPECIES: DUF4468 domain-containing protein [unclassified Dysgonomonas]|uniref:DUF4468 domain-containing protein n=1 Tax=unclassified Dysgonomonas TaxID=2630389 RepID=UPI0013EB7D93|nr:MULTISPECIES: DUF4468 domain-containing protein [unclassified Dysgonomonas]
MKKLLFIILFSFGFIGFCNSQSKELMEKFESDKSMYTIDGKNIVVSKVIDNVPGTKDEIYIKTKNFFARNYKDANSVLQTDDKESGVIIGKGSFPELKEWTDLFGTKSLLSAYHILRVDIKDGRIRVICSADEWFLYKVTGKGARSSDEGYIIDYAPFTNKRFVDKGKQTEAFINLVGSMNATIDSLEKSIKDGALKQETDEW